MLYAVALKKKNKKDQQNLAQLVRPVPMSRSLDAL